MNTKARDWIVVGFGFLCVLGSSVTAFFAYRIESSARRIATDLQLANEGTKKTQESLSAIAQDVGHLETKANPIHAVGLKAFAYDCATGAVDATCQFTNTGDEPALACFRAVVHRKASSATAESLITCSGTLWPGESKAVSAQYRVGAVEALCPRPGGFGVDWDNCSFTVDDATSEAKLKQ